MGQDKAYLPVEWEGASMPLWERQLAVLQSLAPGKLVISGPRKQGTRRRSRCCRTIGPGWVRLGGIATCLSRIAERFLLVLAIDLPQIQPGIFEEAIGPIQKLVAAWCPF